MKTVLLDTSAFTALFKGDDKALSVMAGADTVYASVIAVGELEAGFRGGSRYEENRAMLERFLAKPTVITLDVTRETSDCFGRIKDYLKKKGRPLPINDIWIAAQCIETGAVLIAYDSHFDAVDGLRLW